VPVFGGARCLPIRPSRHRGRATRPAPSRAGCRLSRLVARRSVRPMPV